MSDKEWSSNVSRLCTVCGFTKSQCSCKRKKTPEEIEKQKAKSLQAMKEINILKEREIKEKVMQEEPQELRTQVNTGKMQFSFDEPTVKTVITVKGIQHKKVDFDGGFHLDVRITFGEK